MEQEKIKTRNLGKIASMEEKYKFEVIAALDMIRKMNFFFEMVRKSYLHRSTRSVREQEATVKNEHS